MRWRGGVLKPPDQERKKLLQRSASLEIPRYSGLSLVSKRGREQTGKIVLRAIYGMDSAAHIQKRQCKALQNAGSDGPR